MAFPAVYKTIDNKRIDVNNLSQKSLYALLDGKSLFSINATNIRKLPTTASEILAKAAKGQFIGSFKKGDWANRNKKDGYWWVKVVPNSLLSKASHVYVRIDVVDFKSTKAIDVDNVKGAENKYNSYLKNEYALFHNILGNDILLAYARTQGIPVDTINDLMDKNRAIAANYVKRRTAANRLNFIDIIKTGIEKSFVAVFEKSPSFRGLSGTGLGTPALIPIVISIVKWAAISGLVAWFMNSFLSPTIEGHSDDVKVAEDIENIIKTHPNGGDKIYSEFEKNMQAQLDEAYEKGAKEGSKGSTSSMIKYLAIAGITFMGANFLMQRRNNG